MSFLAAYTLLHVLISLVGIGTGLVVLFGMLGAKRLDAWTSVFLWTTVATSVTGFGFPVDRILPSHVVGVISLVALTFAILARYRHRMAGRWRAIYVITAVMSLYLNVFVLIVQLFLKVPGLHALAPTQTEPPFQIAQLANLVAFATAGIAAVIRFRVAPGPAAHVPVHRREQVSV